VARGGARVGQGRGLDEVGKSRNKRGAG